ncbi:MAG: cupin domain-containing protein [Syntrophothermus sp.]
MSTTDQNKVLERDMLKRGLFFTYSAFFIMILILSIFSSGCTKASGTGGNALAVRHVKQAKTDKFVFPTENLKRYKFPTHINDIIIDRAESSFSEVFMVVVEPDKAPPFHKHDDTEQIFYVVEGTGTLTIGDKKEQFRVEPGDVVRIPVATFHSIKADKETLKYLCVDCFGAGRPQEPTWDDHVKVLCKTNNWDYNTVVMKEPVSHKIKK